MIVLARAIERTLEPTADPAWILTAEGFDSLRETTIESRFAITNGFLGVRGGRPVTSGARWGVPPRTYVAGLFDKPRAESAFPAIVPAADWLQLRISIRGEPVAHHPFDAPLHRMTLDMRRGVLLTECSQFRHREGSMRLRTALGVAQ
jgi:trehalose/maltose hydrolase-like predicted phosphorylase